MTPPFSRNRSNVLWYEGEKYRYNLLKEQTDYMSDGREYKLKRRESLIWRYGGSSVIDWEYSNSYGTPYFVPINAVLGSFYHFADFYQAGCHEDVE